MILRHPTAANVVQFCDGAQLHICARLVSTLSRRALYVILRCCKHPDQNTLIYQAMD